MHGWPLLDRSWVNPSPNAPNLSMARAYAGTVMLEGATLSEGRGTTRPLELFGAPDIDARAVIAEMQALAPQWLGGCVLRDMWFEPTFHKHVGKLCSGVQIHVDHPAYDHAAFKPWRVQALGFKKGADALHAFALIDEQERHVLMLELCVLHHRHLAPAGWAPGGPQVDHQRTALITAQLH